MAKWIGDDERRRGSRPCRVTVKCHPENAGPMDRTSRRESSNPARQVRRLFLDDDPLRAARFLAEYPDAVWVTTVVQCIERLQTRWDEVHLDHDLGGERHVDVARDDCGMAVVRWLSFEPRPHLRTTRFFVHSHNGAAAYVMVLQLKSLGLRVQSGPFDLGHWKAKPRRVWRPNLIERALGSLSWRRGTMPSKDPGQS